MQSVRRAISAIRRIWWLARDTAWELQRWRSGTHHPALRVERRGPVHWGGTEVAVTVANGGDREAVDCRYCQYRIFSMGDAGHGGMTSTAAAWYLTDAFDVPAGGRALSTAYATDDGCARIIMGSHIEEPLDDTSCSETLVCRDRFGTLYRFRTTGSGAPEVWRGTTVDRLLKRRPPAWTAWLDTPSTVQSKVWTSDFRQESRRR